jgi:protein translocase SecG subunit
MIAMIVISVSMVVVILMQKRGSGVGAVFGGSSGAYRSKRGAEKILHYITIVLAFLFASVSLVLLLI